MLPGRGERARARRGTGLRRFFLAARRAGRAITRCTDQDFSIAIVSRGFSVVSVSPPT